MKISECHWFVKIIVLLIWSVELFCLSILFVLFMTFLA